MTVRVIDLETTGVDPETDAIIEIASVDMLKVEAGFNITNERATLVFPGCPIPPQASAVHHLIHEDVEKAPRLSEVIEQFAGAHDYIAHNCDFEKGFIGKYLGASATWICTYKCALRVWPEAPGHSNQVLRYWRNLVYPFARNREDLVAHRALGDAIVTAALFVELMKVGTKWSDMVKWSSEPAFYTRFTFGKHRGKRYDEAPVDYLQWICEKSDLDDDTKFSALHWLAVMTAPKEEAVA
jgi:exodeoxyribonuclease X